MSILPIIVSSLCTGLGALPILLVKDVSHRGKDVLLASAAGIMVAASAYGLIPNAIKLSNVTVLVIGILFGTLVLTLLESMIPHVDLDHSEQPLRKNRTVFLFLVAMSLHNLPEGLSVGISNASENHEVGSLVSFAIGLQNIPDGFLVALFLLSQNVSVYRSILLATLTGFIEMSAGLMGVLLGDTFEPIIPYGLAFAAGSMLFVVYKELIPESHGDGNERASTWAFIIGFVAMIIVTEVFR